MQVLKKLSPVALGALLISPKRKEKVYARTKPKKKKNVKAKGRSKKCHRRKKTVCKQRFRF